MSSDREVEIQHRMDELVRKRIQAQTECESAIEAGQTIIEALHGALDLLTEVMMEEQGRE